MWLLSASVVAAPLLAGGIWLTVRAEAAAKRNICTSRSVGNTAGSLAAGEGGEHTLAALFAVLTDDDLDDDADDE